MDTTQFTNKKILVAGLGKSGMATLRFLNECGAMISGYDKILSDEKRSTLAQEFPHASFYSDELGMALTHEQFDAIVLSPGISAFLPEINNFRNKGRAVLGDIAILCSLIQGKRDKIIAITGSNGKSTVTELTGFLCRECGLDTVVAGNIGLPVLQAYQERQGESADVWVLELSSFQLETTPHLDANAAACLNISEDHLDRYNNLLHYAHSKDAIFNGVQTQVLNADDILCCTMKRPNVETKMFSLMDKNSDFYFDGQHFFHQGKSFFDINNIALQGKHNAANIMAAIALCESIGLKREDLLAALPRFTGLPHRTEKVGEKNGVVFIDDSKGTNVGATAAAISGLNQPIILIAGGLGKGQDFTPLAEAAIDKVKATFLIGKDAPLIEKAFAAKGLKTEFCETLQEAVEKSFQVAQNGDCVLLSPACASMDMFRDYAHRSEIFIESFKALK